MTGPDNAGSTEIGKNHLEDPQSPTQVEEHLRRTQCYLTEAERLSHSGSFVWDVRRPGPVYWSAEMCRIHGRDPAQGAPLFEEDRALHSPEDWAGLMAAAEESIGAKTDIDYDSHLFFPDGSTKHIRIVAHPVVNSAGDVVQFVGTTMDVTEQHRAKEALERALTEIKKSEERLRTIIDTIPAMAWCALPDGFAEFHNQRWLDYTGLSDEEGRGWGWRTAIHPEDLQDAVDEWRDIIASKKPGEGERLIRRFDGEYRWFMCRVEPLMDEQGNVVRWYGTATDIEDRKKAEDKIRRSETELRQILDLTPQSVVVLAPDRDRTRLYANQTALDYLGFTLEEWQNTDRHEFIHPDDWERVSRETQDKFLSGLPHECEARVRGKDGKYRWFLLCLNPVRDEQGRVTRWYSATTDIDDRKQAEQRLQNENIALREEVDQASMFEEIVGPSAALRRVLSQVAKVAPTDSTVLILGETGTGKELIARAIHNRSNRSMRAFVRVNCAAIPQPLIASELFGHEKGAFTGATQRRLGRFELSHEGTIFLDEVGELPAETQIALLRVLQEREFERVGGSHPISVDVRVLAATNRNLKAAVDSGSFRQDLFYRLNVFPIEIPPLRERIDDIPVLVEYLVERYAKKAGKRITKITKKTLELFQAYAWPGNIRELQNVVERAVVLSDGDTFWVDESWLERKQPPESPRSSMLEKGLLRLDADREREIIEAALSEAGGRIAGPSGAAAKLGIPRQTLDSKISILGIKKTRFKSS